MVAGSDPGHALPAIGVSAALIARGHEVRLLTGAAHRVTARACQVPHDLLPVLPPDARDRDIGHRLWGRAAELARVLAAQLGPWRPEVIVVDSLLPSAGLAAQLLGLPWVELIPHHLPDPAPDLPPVGLGRRAARSPLRRADDRRIHRAQLRSLQLGRDQARAAARALGSPEPGPPTVRLVATSPALERPRATWPPTAHVVGSLAVDPALPELDPPPGREPLVLVTDSTARSITRSIGEVAVRALEHAPVRVVVTSGNLAPAASDRVVVGRGPHGPLLARAVLAVGPGGGGFVSKVAAAGVPIVVVPLAGDQREAAARLRDTRAGRIVTPRHLTPARLRWTVLRHLADGAARRAAAGLACSMEPLGADLAARLVAEVASGRTPLASGPGHHLQDVPPRGTIAAPRSGRPPDLTRPTRVHDPN